MPVTPICVGDRAQISLALASLMGSIDLASIEWQPLMVEPLPSQNTIRNYNRSYNITPDRNKFQKYFADLSRVCDLEDTVNEWFDKEYLYEVGPVSLTQHIKRHIDDLLAQLRRQFRVCRVEVGGIDFSVWKVYLKALDSGATNESVFYTELNTQIQIVNEGPLVNEVKKSGVIIDRGLELQYRGGDLCIVYLSMGGFER